MGDFAKVLYWIPSWQNSGFLVVLHVKLLNFLLHQHRLTYEAERRSAVLFVAHVVRARHITNLT